MMPYRWVLSCLLLAACPLIARAQKASPREAVIIYKDGFVLRGKLNEKVGNIITDSASGRSFAIPSGEFAIDDHVRNINFSPGQVQKVIEIKPGESKPQTVFYRYKFIRQPLFIHPTWEFEFGSWSEKGERTVTSNSLKAPRTMTQKIAVITPQHIGAFTVSYKWDLSYFTREFGPEWTRDFLMQIINDNKELKALDEGKKQLKIATFMQEAGWDEEAETDLLRIVRNFQAEKKTAEEMLNQLKDIRANQLVETMEQRASVGQHQDAIERLEVFDRGDFPKRVSPKNRAAAQDAKIKYDKTKTAIEQAKEYLRTLPTYAPARNRPVWAKASTFIEQELNYDTIERLSTFLELAPQFELERKEKRKTTQSAEEVLALAASGWLQGKHAAFPEPKSALMLIRARELVLAYLRTNDAQERAGLLSTLKSETELPADVIVRLLSMIPPAHAEDVQKLTTTITTMTINVPDGNGSYLVQLPPEYHHLRWYPVLILLHNGREKAEDMMARFTKDAANAT